jgi:hypothetical protein
MKANLFWTLTAVTMLTLAGCNKAESPAKVDSDVAKATASAEKQDLKAEDKEAKTDASVSNDLSKDVDKADSKAVGAAADDAVTQAEGDTEVALAKCKSLAGDAQKACKDQAKAQLDMVKARAKALKADHG